MDEGDINEKIWRGGGLLLDWIKSIKQGEVSPTLNTNNIKLGITRSVMLASGFLALLASFRMALAHTKKALDTMGKEGGALVAASSQLILPGCI